MSQVSPNNSVQTAENTFRQMETFVKNLSAARDSQKLNQNEQLPDPKIYYTKNDGVYASFKKHTGFGSWQNSKKGLAAKEKTKELFENFAKVMKFNDEQKNNVLQAIDKAFDPNDTHAPSALTQIEHAGMTSLEYALSNDSVDID